MSGPRCPRCHREAPGPTAFCAGCGAPLLLGDDAPAGPLDVSLELDRRSRGVRPRGEAPAPAADLRAAPAPPPLRGIGPRASELADVERSHWDLGPIVAPVTKAGATPAPSATPTATPTASAAAAGVPAPAAVTSSSTWSGAPAAGGDGGLGQRDLLHDDLPEPEVDALEVHVARAEPWRRAVAWAVDGIPFLAAGGGAAFVLLREAAEARGGPPRALLDVVDLLSAERVIALSIAAAIALALASYATLAHALAGATLGKRLVGLRVVGPDGGPPSPARSAVRSAVALLSAALLGLGFLLALFTRTGRALHDLLAGTWVVKAP